MLNPAFHEEMQHKAPRCSPFACRAGRGPALAAALGGALGSTGPGRPSASGSIPRASSRHPHRPPLGAQLKTGRLPHVRRGTHGPASGLKAGVQPNAHREHVWLQVNGPCIPTGPCECAAPRGKKPPAAGVT